MPSEGKTPSGTRNNNKREREAERRVGSKDGYRVALSLRLVVSEITEMIASVESNSHIPFGSDRHHASDKTSKAR